MVANLSSHKPGWDARWQEFSAHAEKGQQLKDQLLRLVDEDTKSFNAIMSAFGLPKGTEEEKAARSASIQAATLYATEIPLQVMKTAFDSMAMIHEMARVGNPNSVSDAGVGILCARTAVMGAWLNVKINAAGLKDKAAAARLTEEAAKIAAAAQEMEDKTITIVNENIK
jgi:glutamate formiminotransferase/formiminotetrahydrofolate cyclodeaminase